MGFFSSRERLIQAYAEALRLHGSDDRRAQLLLSALKVFLDSPEEYDEYAPLTTSWIGSSLESLLVNKGFSEESIRRALSMSARIIRESTLRRSAWNSAEREILDFFLEDKFSLEGDERLEADYIRYALPRSVVEEILVRVQDAERSAMHTKEGLIKGTSELEKRIEGHRTELEKLSSEFNFVGLSAAFARLLEVKSSEKRAAFHALLLFGLLAVVFPMFLLARSVYGEGVDQVGALWSPSHAFGIIAAAGLEVVLLYFFRVALKNYQAAKAQITNLQLRNALCAFIEGYSEFRTRMGKDKDLLSGFEGLIFSALPVDGSSLPATLDGVGDLAELVRELRSS